MKQTVKLVAIFMLLSTSLMAQVFPSSYTFQGVARDADGSPSKETTIVVEVSLYPASSGGDAEWLQEFTPVTDKYGVFSILIGDPANANKITGATKLTDLAWNKKQYFVKVRQKIGDTYYDVNIGRTPLNAVPYSFVAQKVVEKQTLSLNSKGDSLLLTDGGKVKLPQGFSGKYADLEGQPTQVSAFANDAKYVITETDPVFNVSVAKNIKKTDTTRWALDNQKLVLNGQYLSIVGGNEVNLSKIEFSTPIFHSAMTQPLTGTLDIAPNSTKAFGNGTTFRKQLAVGTAIRIENTIYKIVIITSDIQMTLDKPMVTGGTEMPYFTDGTIVGVALGGGDTVSIIDQNARLHDKTGLVMPVGSVIPYAGNKLPQGWLLCDGRAVGRNIYSELYSALGNSWGAGDGTTTFNLPDLRGQFLRGVDGAANVDTDSRTAKMTGGNTGDTVGTYQIDIFESHTHTTSVSTDGNHNHGASTAAAGQHSHSVTVVSNDSDGIGSDMPRTSDPDSQRAHVFGTSADGNHAHSIGADGNHSHTVTNASTGGIETRPVNASVFYIIKY